MIASEEIAVIGSGSHQTSVSPDGRYVFIGAAFGDTIGEIVKVDARTLKPVELLHTGGQLHHGQVF